MTVLTSLQVSAVLSYVIAIAVPALDAVFPVLPSETAIIALGVATAGSTDPRIALLVVCCAMGAFLGDNLSYLLGRRFGPWAERRFFPGEKGARRRAWAERSLERFGMQLIVVCRFFPGGRTAVTLYCGLIGYPADASSSRPRWRARSGPCAHSSSAVSAEGRSRTGRGPGSWWRSA